MFWPVPLVVGTAGAIGLIKLLFGLHGLVASTVLSTSAGPIALVFLAALDSAVGACLLTGATGVLARKEWAREVLAQGSLLIVGYEIGRAVGLAVAWREHQDFYGVLSTVVLAIVLLAMTGLARSSQTEAYIRSRPG